MQKQRWTGVLMAALVAAAGIGAATAQGVARFANFLPDEGVFAVVQPAGALTGEERLVGQLFFGGSGPGFLDATAVGEPIALTASTQAGGYVLDALVTLPGVLAGEMFSGRAVYWDARFGGAAETFQAALEGNPALMGVSGATGVAGSGLAPGRVELAPVVLLPGAVIPEPSPWALGLGGALWVVLMGWVRSRRPA